MVVLECKEVMFILDVIKLSLVDFYFFYLMSVIFIVLF